MNNYLTGQLGEQSVAQYLTDRRYKMVECNYRQKFGEIDIVAISPDKILVFVEVKFLVAHVKSDLIPEDNMTPAKIKKFRKISEYYAATHPELIREKSGWRMDVVAMSCPTAEALANPLRLCEFRHYENI